MTSTRTVARRDIDAAERLSAVLAGFPPDDVEAALPILFLGAARVDPDLVLPAAAEELIGLFMRDQLQVTSSSTPDEMIAALDRFWADAKSPVFLALRQFFREETARGGDGNKAFASFVGRAQVAGVLESGPRPAGTVAAGPLARFLVQKKPAG